MERGKNRVAFTAVFTCLVAFLAVLVMPLTAHAATPINSWTALVNELGKEEESDLYLAKSFDVESLQDEGAYKLDSLSCAIIVKGTHTLDLNGYEIRVSDRTYEQEDYSGVRNFFIFGVSEGANFTMKDSVGEGRVQAYSPLHKYIDDTNLKSIFLVAGNLTVESGKYQAGRYKTLYSTEDSKYGTRMVGGCVFSGLPTGNIVINDGTFETQSTNRVERYRTSIIYLDQCTLTINGGTFTSRNGSHFLKTSDATTGGIQINKAEIRLLYWDKIMRGHCGDYDEYFQFELTTLDGRTGFLGFDEGAIDFPNTAVAYKVSKIGVDDTYTTAEEFREVLKIDQEYSRKDKYLVIAPAEELDVAVTENRIYFENVGDGFETTYADAMTIRRDCQSWLYVLPEEYAQSIANVTYDWYVKEAGETKYKHVKGFDVDAVMDGNLSVFPLYCEATFDDDTTFDALQMEESSTVEIRCISTEETDGKKRVYKADFELTMESGMNRSTPIGVTMTPVDWEKYFTEDGKLRVGTNLADITFEVTYGEWSVADLTWEWEDTNSTTGEAPTVVRADGYYVLTFRVTPSTDYKFTSDTQFLMGYVKEDRIYAYDTKKMDRSYIAIATFEASHDQYIDNVGLTPENFNFETNRLAAGEELKTLTSTDKRFTVDSVQWTANGEPAEIGSTIVTYGIYGVEVHLTAAEGYLFDPYGDYVVGNVRCFATVSEDWKEVTLKTATWIFSGCAHRNDGTFSTDNDYCWQTCLDCGEIYNKHAHSWRRSDIASLSICAYCGEGRRRSVTSGYLIKKALVQVEMPVIGETMSVPEMEDSYKKCLEIVEYQWYKGEATDENKREAGKETFRAGNQYRLKVTVAAREGYYFNSSTLINCNATAKDPSFSDYENNYQIFDSVESTITVMYLFAAPNEIGKSTVKLPTIEAGQTLSNVVSQISIQLTNVSNAGMFGFYATIARDGEDIAKATNTMGFTSFSKDYAADGTAVIEKDHAYTLRIEPVFLQASVPEENVTVTSAGNANSYSVRQQDFGYSLYACYLTSDKVASELTIAGIQTPVSGDAVESVKGTPVGPFDIQDLAWETKDAAFLCNIKYILSGHIVMKNGYKGTDDLKVTVGGVEASVEYEGNDIYAISAAFTPSHILGSCCIDNVVEGTATSEGSYDLEYLCAECGATLKSEHFITGKKYKIIVTIDEEYGMAGAKVESAAEGEAVELYCYNHSGYYLAGWQVIHGGVTVVDDGFIMGDTYVELKAIMMRQGATVFDQPTDVTVMEGESAKFTVGAYGMGDLQFQWQKSTNGGVTWSNSTSTGCKTSQLTVVGNLKFNGYKFRCAVTDESGVTVYSYPGVLNVKRKAVSITSQPTNQTVSVNEVFHFTVAVDGSDVSFRWQKSTNGVDGWKSCSDVTAGTEDYHASAKISYNGLYFRCAITNLDGNTIYSNAAKLTVKEANASSIQIVSQTEENLIAKVGSVVEFKVNAAGDVASYRWEKKTPTSTTWAKCATTGWDTDTMPLTIKAGFDQYKFRCVLTDSKGNTVTTKEITLTVVASNNTPCSIIAQPKGVSATVGETVSFSVQADGSNLSFQWEKSTDGGNTWVNSGSTGAKTEKITMVAKISFNGLQFRCKMTAKDGTFTYSNPATLTVTAATADGPVITSQPADVTAPTMTNVSFSVEAKGDGLTYQWMKSTNGGTTWVNSGSTGAKTATLSMSTRVSYNGMKLKCVVTDQNGKSVTSKVVTLTVK